ncbi:MAG: hypothetical protein ACPG5W_09245, partial [Flavobacteriales bacterium]
MRVILLLVLVLFSAVSRGQDYVAYHQQLNEAKLLAVNGEFGAATQLFEITFREFDFKYARDCVHAVETATLARDTALLNYFIQCGLKQGIPLSYFQEKAGLEWFVKTDSWADLLMSADSLSQLYKGSI